MQLNIKNMIIYKITNLTTGKFYIGLTIQNINTRFNHHVYEAKLGSTSYLHRSILKHGKENFKIEKLKEIVKSITGETES